MFPDESKFQFFNDEYGNQWTRYHQRMEQLFQLGIGKIKCLMPHEMWSILPRGMPYYEVAKRSKSFPVVTNKWFFWL